MKRSTRWLLSIATLVILGGIFIAPFAFIFLTAAMDRTQANELKLAWPRNPQVLQNLMDVFSTRDYMLVVAFINSAILTVASVSITVILAAMVAFVIQRRPDGLSKWANALVLSGLIIPPAVVPTIWVMQGLGVFKTMPGMILIEVAYGLAFCIVIFRAFIAGIPKELDEAAIMDGVGSLRLFFVIVFPLLKPTIVTAVVVQSVAVFNDFVNPLYYLPSHPTVQLTLYNFQSQYSSQYNLLFMDILLITLPPLAMFMIFNKQMVAGMMSGSVKG